jgi:hypothetical protein
MSEQNICFEQSHAMAIADALGHTSEGLSGSEIDFLLQLVKIKDVSPDLKKSHRLYNAFGHDQNTRKHRRHILEFIRRAMKPERYIKDPYRFERLRVRLKQALAFAGLVVTESGSLEAADRVATLSEARRRAEELRADLSSTVTR